MILGAVALACVGCAGPTVATTTLASAPSQPANCSVAIVPHVASDSATPGGISFPAAPAEKWQVVGTVGVAAIGIDGPFADAHFDDVRAEACAMGGEAVAVMGSAMAAKTARSSDLVYAVLRKPSATKQAATDARPRAVDVR